jgi:ligand-binding sensor domain-containing protein/two-component sensor histidine kinase
MKLLSTVYVAMLLANVQSLLALDPSKALTQYTRTVWRQEQGLPQDTVRAISQTSDGHLWLGTNEGLVRFDGYDFVTFTKGGGALPGNTVAKLCASTNGDLWIGTFDGLALYSKGHFKVFTARDGLPSGSVTALTVARNGAVWFAAGGIVSRYQNGKFTNFPKANVDPITPGRLLFADSQDQIWVGGKGGVARLSGDRFVPVFAKELNGYIVTSMLENARGLWIGGTKGILLVRPDGTEHQFTKRDGLPGDFVLAMREDREGNLWAGTSVGLSRLQNGRFSSFPAEKKEDQDLVWSLFEDREGDLWVGNNSSVSRLRDDLFTTYGQPEGLPGDEPFIVHQDRNQKMWVGYHDSGVIQFEPGKIRSFTTRDGLSSNEVFNLRDDPNGDLLIGTRGGLDRFHAGNFTHYVVPNPETKSVYDALVDRHGTLWAANSAGVFRFNGAHWHSVASGFGVSLLEASDGTLWAALLHTGLVRIKADSTRQFTTRDGLGSNELRSLYAEPDGTLWIGTFGGGLSFFKDGVFRSFTARDGLLSDNISHIEDDGHGYFWLSTTRGICRIAKQQLRDFAAGKLHELKPDNYGVADGLRSAQGAPAVPAGGGGTRSSDGRLWFTTGRGVAMIDPQAAPKNPSGVAPFTSVNGIAVDGHAVDEHSPARFKPGTGQVQLRYTGLYLSAPERLRYSYKLEGLEQDWIPAEGRRVITYNPLPAGRYNFRVRAMLPNGGSSESHFSFEVQPHIYQTRWFYVLCGLSLMVAIYAIYYFRLKQIQSRLSLVAQERVRMAREIHDTLAQGLVGISHQLDALSMKLHEDVDVAQQHLDLARRMARHSLTEARRSVFDLRSSELEKKDLQATLSASAPLWGAGSRVEIKVEVPDVAHSLPADVEQHLLRIAQEAVANAVRHAKATVILVQLEIAGRFLKLRVNDNGQGFQATTAFSLFTGHFGIRGMRERTERLGGEFALISGPGAGTSVEVTVPLG